MTEAEELELLELEEQEAAQQPAAPKEKPQGVLGAVGAAMGSTPELQPYGKAEMPEGPESASLKDAAMGGLNAARETLASPMRTGQTVMEAPDVLGEGIAVGTGESNNPVVRGAGVALGGAVQMAPYLTGAAQGLKALYTSGNKYAQGITKTPQEIGKMMGKGEKMVDVGDHLPELRGSKPTFPEPEMRFPVNAPQGGTPARFNPETELFDPAIPAKRVPAGANKLPKAGPYKTIPEVTPASYPSDKGTFLNMADERMKQFGEQLGPQEVSDYHNQITDWFNRMKIDPNTKIGAIASKTAKRAAELRGTAIPGGTTAEGEFIPSRAALDETYGISKTLHPQIMKALKKHFSENAGKYGAAIAGGTVLGASRR